MGTNTKKRFSGLGACYLFLICIVVGIILILLVIYVKDSSKNIKGGKCFSTYYSSWESKLEQYKDDWDKKTNGERRIRKPMRTSKLFPYVFAVQLNLDENVIPPNSLSQAGPSSSSDEKNEPNVNCFNNELIDVFPLPFDNVIVNYNWCRDTIWPEPFETIENVLSEKDLATIITNGKALEETLEGKEWQPWQSGVLKLVDPLLFCLISDVTLFRLDTEDRELETPFKNTCPEYSRHFQMLPMEFYFDPDSEKVIALSYINNLDPRRHEDLYRFIEMLIAKAVPLFEKVLTALINVHYTDEYIPVSLRGRRLQMIVGMTSIHLTPDSPKYNGSDWEVAGLINERIVASAIYYYDVDNTFESLCVSCHRVCLRCQIGGTRDRGWILSTLNRLVVFPNIYETRIEPFRLNDPTKPGHRKFIRLFLVDPNIRIISTANVPPQQQSWYPITEREAVEKFKFGYSYNENDTKTLYRAKYYRDKAMEERRQMKRKYLHLRKFKANK